MNEVLYRTADHLSDIFLVWSVILYYLSIKKCFLKGDKSKGKLFVLVLFTNPTILRFVSFFTALPLRYTVSPTDYTRFLYASATSIVFVVLVFLFSNLIGILFRIHPQRGYLFSFSFSQ